MKRLKLDDWITTQRRRKWRWAGKLALTSRSDWTAMAVRWDPTLDPRLNARRRPGRPKTRWMDDIYNHVLHTKTSNYQPTQELNSNNDGDDNTNITDNDDDTTTTNMRPGDSEHWLHIASDAQMWAALEEGFVRYTR